MEAGEFFDQKTPMRLRLIGWTIIVASLLRSLITYMFGIYTTSLITAIPSVVKTTVADPLGKPVAVYTGPFIDIPSSSLLIGAVILALAFAFQKGLELKQEQSLVV
jgi:hypothetical protein